jgi:hypothetical protein
VVSDWSDWSECVEGSQTRTRTVITPASGGGQACSSLSETRSCTINTDCVVSAWSSWSACVEGEKTRTRTIVTPASGSGAACLPLTETASCSTACIEYLVTNTNDPQGQADNIYVQYIDCNGLSTEIEISAGSGLNFCAQEGSYTLPEGGAINVSGSCAPVDCVVSEWSEWSTCTNNQRSRTRTVITPSSKGGAACPTLIEYDNCVNCVVSEWSEWSACVDGFRTQTRTVITPASGGGSACPSLTNTESCSTPVCCGDIYFEPSSYTDENLTYQYEDCATGQIQYITVYYNSSGETVYGRIPC